jgi:hypothetical protein
MLLLSEVLRTQAKLLNTALKASFKNDNQTNCRASITRAGVVLYQIAN